MNPYSVLGVSPSATDDEVKAAYRKLVKKYHPDRYTDSKLKEEASEKLKEINAAYDEIERTRSGKGSAGGYQNAGGGYQYQNTSTDPRFNNIRMHINNGDLTTAESLLDAMTSRPAEWHYLKGVILLRRGWYDGARQHFTNAVQMDPTNREYAQAYQSVNSFGARGFGNYYGNQNSTGGCSTCDVCMGLMCMDMCCGRNCC